MTSAGSGPFEATDACHSTWQPQEGRQPSALREPTALPAQWHTRFLLIHTEGGRRGLQEAPGPRPRGLSLGLKPITKLDASFVKNYFS